MCSCSSLDFRTIFKTISFPHLLMYKSVIHEHEYAIFVVCGSHVSANELSIDVRIQKCSEVVKWQLNVYLMLM